MQVGDVSAVHEYGQDVKGLVLKAKRLSGDAVKAMASEMASLIPEGSYLVPIPSHDGSAGSPEEIARCIEDMKRNVFVLPILSGRRRRSQYRTKKSGGLLSGSDFGFSLLCEPDPLERIWIIDDVAGTGETLRAAMALLPGAKAAVYAIDTNKYIK